MIETIRVTSRADFERLPPEIQRQVREQYRRKKTRSTLEGALGWRGVTLYRWQRQLARLLTSAVKDTLAGRGRNIIIQAAPRVGKTRMVAGELLPWALRTAEVTPGAPFGGALPVMLIGAEGSLTERVSEEAQAAYMGWADLYPEAGGRGSKWTKTEWKTSEGGRVIARGINANITGGGYLLGSFDDLLSIGDTGKAAKESAWDTFRRQGLSRRMSGATTILSAHRLAVDDPSGRWIDLMEQGGIPYEVHTWRMEAEEDEYDGDGELFRRRGDLLCPELVGPELIREAKLDPWFWSTTYQQRPTKEGGSVIQESWCGHRYPGDPHVARTACLRVYVVVDPAGKTKDHNDPTAIGVLGVRGDGKILVLHVEAERREYPAMRQRVRDLVSEWRADGAAVEDTSTGLALVPDLRSLGVPVVAVSVAGKGDKVARMTPHLVRWEGGMILLPESARWLASFVGELTTVPFAQHDDQWDMMSVGLAHIAQGDRRIRPMGLNISI